MDEEIEYLSEEDILKATSNPVELFYVYFDETGTIYGIFPGPNTDSIHNFITVEYKRVEKFILGSENTSNYIVSLVDKDTPLIVKRTEDAAENTNLLISIDAMSNSNTTLNVKWDLENKQWCFYINPEFKEQFKSLGLITPLLFFITEQRNANFLLNSISINLQELLSSDQITVPWASVTEENFDKVAVSTKRFFDSYGLLKNE